MGKGVTILGVLALLLSCNSKKDTSQHELGLVYNVLRDVDIDNYEVYSMNLDGSNKKTSQTFIMWSGPIILTRTLCILFLIEVPASVATFCTRAILKEKIQRKLAIWNWPIAG